MTMGTGRTKGRRWDDEGEDQEDDEDGERKRRVTKTNEKAQDDDT